MKKYRLTNEKQECFGHTVYRIEALRDFANVKKGDKGGWIEKEENLTHFGDSWVSENACVSETACVAGNAFVSGNACLTGNVYVTENACLIGDAYVRGDACVKGNAELKSIEDCFSVSGIGSRFGTTTVFTCSDGVVRLTCGCFYGTVEEFEKAVEKKHGDSKYGREYKAVIELIKVHFDLTGERSEK